MADATVGVEIHVPPFVLGTVLEEAQSDRYIDVSRPHADSDPVLNGAGEKLVRPLRPGAGHQEEQAQCSPEWPARRIQSPRGAWPEVIHVTRPYAWNGGGGKPCFRGTVEKRTARLACGLAGGFDSFDLSDLRLCASEELAQEVHGMALSSPSRSWSS